MPHLACLALERHLKTWTRRHEATESHGELLKGNTRHSVDESWGIEITEKADRSASQFEIRQNLRLVDRQDFLDCLDLEDQRFVHHEIDPKSVWDHSRFVNDGDQRLSSYRKPFINQLPIEALFISRFEEARSQFSVDRNAGAYYPTRQVFQFWMAESHNPTST